MGAKLDDKQAGATPSRIKMAGTVLSAICTVFVVAMISLPRLDTALHVALLAFAIAIPLLANELYVHFLKSVIRAIDQLTSDVLKFLGMASAYMSILGYLAATVGFFAFFWHLWEPAAFALLGALVLTVIVTPALSIALRYTIGRKPEGAPSPPNPERLRKG